MGPFWARLAARRSVRAALGGLAATVALSGLTVVGTRSVDDAGHEELTAGGGVRPAMVAAPRTSDAVTIALDAVATTTTAPGPVVPPVTAPPVTVVRPDREPAPEPEPSEPPPPPPVEAPGMDGPVAVVDQPGIYVLDVASGGVRRIHDLAPFDVAGNDVLVGVGLDVYALPVSGSAASLRYRLPANPTTARTGASYADLSREAITRIVAAPDGRAVVTAMAPFRDRFGAVGCAQVVTPDGRVLVEDHPAFTVAWSDDSQALASYSFGGLALFGADGQQRALIPGQSMNKLRWAPDGRSVLGRSTDITVRYDLVTGTWRTIPIFDDPDPGPGGRVVGVGLHDTGDGPMGTIDVWDPATGGVTTISRYGAGPRWSDDGARVAFVGQEYTPNPYDSEPLNQHLRVVEADGRPVFSVQPTDGLSIPSEGLGNNGPEWAAGDSMVVFAVAASDQTFGLP